MSIDFRGLVLLISVVVICFLIGEFSLRSMEVTDRLGFHRVPSSQERVLIAGDAPQGRVRIVGVGDSFTIFRDLQGRNYLRYAQKMASLQATHLDVVNLSNAGTDLHDYFKNIYKSHDRLQPDIVTIGLYLGNDVGRSGSLTLEQVYRNGMLVKGFEGIQQNWRRDLVSWLKKSILLNYSFRILKIYVPNLRSNEYTNVMNHMSSTYNKNDKFIQAGLSKIDTKLVKLAKSDAINPWDLAMGLFEPNHYRDLYYLSTKKAVENLHKMTTDLDFMINWIRDHGMKPIVVLLHPGIIVGKRYHEYYKRLVITLPDTTSKSFPLTDQLISFLKQKDTLFVDTLSALRSEKGDLYIPNDIHLNSDGQRIVGRLLFDLLKTKKLLTK
jgi:lysophospholipase L1-like esterase